MNAAKYTIGPTPAPEEEDDEDDSESDSESDSDSDSDTDSDSDDSSDEGAPPKKKQKVNEPVASSSKQKGKAPLYKSGTFSSQRAHDDVPDNQLTYEQARTRNIERNAVALAAVDARWAAQRPTPAKPRATKKASAKGLAPSRKSQRFASDNGMDIRHTTGIETGTPLVDAPAPGPSILTWPAPAPPFVTSATQPLATETGIPLVDAPASGPSILTSPAPTPPFVAGAVQPTASSTARSPPIDTAPVPLIITTSTTTVTAPAPAILTSSLATVSTPVPPILSAGTSRGGEALSTAPELPTVTGTAPPPPVAHHQPRARARRYRRDRPRRHCRDRPRRRAAHPW